MGNEPDMKAMEEFYPDEEETNENDPVNVRVNENNTVNVRVNDLVNRNDPVNDLVNGNDPVNGTINERLLVCITKTYKEFAALLGKSPATIKRLLKQLREDGSIRRIGADKNGHWEVIR